MYKEYKEPGPGTRPSFLGFQVLVFSLKSIKNMRRGIFGVRPHPNGRCNDGPVVVLGWWGGGVVGGRVVGWSERWGNGLFLFCLEQPSVFRI